VGTGSLVTANLTDTGALGAASLKLAGGTLIIDPTASRSAHGLASKFVTRANNTLALDDFTQAAISGPPAGQTAAVPAARALPTKHTAAGMGFGPTVRTPTFGAGGTGMIRNARRGLTPFRSAGNKAMRVYADTVLVLNKAASHAPNGPASGTINLSVGLHDL